MFSFLSPYIAFLYGAAYSVQQILEGIGLASSNFLERNDDGIIAGSYWSATEAATPVLGLLLFYSIILIFTLICAGFVIGRWRGVAIFFAALVLPGFLNVAGLWPQINYLPDSYYIGGGGALGSPLGLAALLIICLLTGWCITVIIYDTLNLNDKFRGYYDHFWYATALLAGIFFVTDSVGNRHVTNLAEKNRVSREASMYLLNQVRSYDHFCSTEGLTEKPSCVWASDVQQTLNEYAANGSDTYHLFGPTDSAEIYAGIRRSISAKEIVEIREEIERYNLTVCPVEELGKGIRRHAKPSGTCQQVPSTFCTSFPDPPEGLVDKYIISRSVALASECIIPTLVASKARQEDLSAAIASNQKDRYQRWWLFVALAAVAGGKIANSTTKIANLDQRNAHDRRRLVRPTLRILSCGTKRIAGIFVAVDRWRTRI